MMRSGAEPAWFGPARHFGSAGVLLAGSTQGGGAGGGGPKGGGTKSGLVRRGFGSYPPLTTFPGSNGATSLRAGTSLEGSAALRGVGSTQGGGAGGGGPNGGGTKSGIVRIGLGLYPPLNTFPGSNGGVSLRAKAASRLPWFRGGFDDHVTPVTSKIYELRLVQFP